MVVSLKIKEVFCLTYFCHVKRRIKNAGEKKFLVEEASIRGKDQKIITF